MSKVEDSAIEVIEEMSKTGYAIGIFAARVFYQVSNIEALKNGLDAFNHERFAQRLEHFQYEHDKINNKEKQAFYEDLENNRQNLNYLYEFMEQTRTTTFDLHAKILARLSVNLIKNKKLNYYESSLISNMGALNDDDFMRFYNSFYNLKITISEGGNSFWSIKPKVMEEEISIRKFINIGIIVEDRKTYFSNNDKRQPIKFYKNDFTDNFLNILNEVISNDIKL